MDNGVIPKSMILQDRFGSEWRRDASYQDYDTSAPGWLALRREDGAVRSFSEAMKECGFDGPGGKYLIVAVDQQELEAARGDGIACDRA